MEDEKKALMIYKQELRNLEKEAKASKEWNVLFPKLCKIIFKVEQYRPNYGFTGYYYACEEDFNFLLNLCYNVIA
jgi:hypothetical protein